MPVSLSIDGATGACINRVTSAWPRRLPAQEIFSPTEFAEVCDDQLFRCFLKSTFVCDIELERFLTAYPLHDCWKRQCWGQFAPSRGKRVTLLLRSRAAVLYKRVHFCLYRSRNRAGTTLAGAANRRPVVRDFHSRALARGCCGVFSPRRPSSGEFYSGPDLGLPLWLSSWRAKCRKGRKNGDCRPPFSASPSSRTACQLLVKQQYEENPYPRWMKAAPVGKAMTIDRYLRRRFPLVPIRNIAGKIRSKFWSPAAVPASMRSKLRGNSQERRCLPLT